MKQVSVCLGHPTVNSHFRYESSTRVLNKKFDRVFESWKSRFAQPQAGADLKFRKWGYRVLAVCPNLWKIGIYQQATACCWNCVSFSSTSWFCLLQYADENVYKHEIFQLISILSLKYHWVSKRWKKRLTRPTSFVYSISSRSFKPLESP